jgi:hypothetical protein
VVTVEQFAIIMSIKSLGDANLMKIEGSAKLRVLTIVRNIAVPTARGRRRRITDEIYYRWNRWCAPTVTLPYSIDLANGMIYGWCETDPIKLLDAVLLKSR